VKKDGSGTQNKEQEKQSAKKWWAKVSGKNDLGSSGSASHSVPTGGDRRRDGGGANTHSFSGGLAPHHQTALASSSRQDLAISPALSRASTLSETDEQYLATQARNSTPRPRPEFDHETFAGAFEPVRQRPQTKYPIPPLTKQQLDALAGAYAPPAPPPRKPDKWGYQ
jgi:hypothetical protein